MRKKFLKIIERILLIIIFIIIVLSIWNLICKEKEQSEIQSAYGQPLEVMGKNMIADVKGEENAITIIVLPGWGSPSPVLEFLPLVDRLSERFRIITIEPFGYGLSDESGTERKLDTIVEELHECTKQLGCD